ncbi:MAG: hypothetical protein LBU30_05535 [Candidatus Methanoplasma sp.]|jgi:membrane protein YqaA with SNARE-associated domain|nr:hypothetical protein [Candidatus Methanoplasma sp.]
MFNIGDWIYGLFGSNGELGILLCVFLIFFIDALVFPTLPELFFVLSFRHRPEMSFGLELLAVAIIAEILGVALLYFIVGHVKIPKRIEKVVNKYIGFLVLGDERLILLNRIAPMFPFCGAFIKIAGWDIKKSLLYVVIGCVAKYGVILLVSDFFFGYFGTGEATLFTVIFTFAIIAISFILSVVYKKKNAIG